MATRTAPPARPRRPDQLRAGPHGLSRDEVIASQRDRILRALTDEVGERGYPPVTVAQVIARAGVSRKSFYEIFGSKEEAFAALYESAANRLLAIAMTAFDTHDRWVDRLRAALTALLSTLAHEPKLARVCFVEADVAGGGLARRQDELMCGFAVLFESPEVEERRLAPMLAMGRVGELRDLIAREIAAGNAEGLTDLVPELMYAMVLPFLGAEAAERELDRAGRRDSDAAPPAAEATGPGDTEASVPGAAPDRAHARDVARSAAALEPPDSRHALLVALAELTAERGYERVTTGQIAARAGLPHATFERHFASREDCLLAAHDAVAERALEATSAAFAATPGGWAESAHAALGALLRTLADEPALTQLSTADIPGAGERVLERRAGLLEWLPEVLAPGAPATSEPPERDAPLSKAITGGIHSLIAAYAEDGRAAELRDALPAATLFTLAPFVGRTKALEVAELPARTAAAA